MIKIFQIGMKKKGVPPKVRRYILNNIEMLRRGVLTFEYLERRLCFQTLEIKKTK